VIYGVINPRRVKFTPRQLSGQIDVISTVDSSQDMITVLP
jgi:hypothetical protein